MAGRGSRFADVGVTLPKPLVPVAGKPMISWALKSLETLCFSEIIFITLEQHKIDYSIDQTLEKICKWPHRVVFIDKVTEGQLCTVLAANKYLNTDEDILISSSDTYVRSNLHLDISNKPADCHGIISVADLPGNRWSFARTDNEGKVIEVAEKVRISDNASTGLYYFSNGYEFIDEAEKMIRNQEKTRGEYYVIPLYQKYIQRGYQIRLSLASEVWDMGNPEALSAFENHLNFPK
jgi:NDP-sugar pyrophosphorylase family protein